MTTPLPLASTVLPREGPQSRLLVLLHGYGQPTAELTDRIGVIDPHGRFRVVVPEAPFERRGHPIWHRAISAREEAEEQYLASLVAIDALLGEAEAELGLPAADAVVGGFSQGGGLALALLLGADVVHRPAAAFGVCSFPPIVTGFRVDRVAAAGRPYFLSSARDDHFAPIEVSRTGAAIIRETGIELTYVESDGGHVMTDDAAAQIGEWLAAVDEGRSRPPLDDDRDALLAATQGRDYFEDLWDLVS